MPALPLIAKWEGIVLLGGMCACVVWKLLTGEISLGELFVGDRNDGSSYASPGRIQLLLFTLFVSFYCLLHLASKPGSFPEIPWRLVQALGVSQVTYLGGKANAMFGILQGIKSRRS